ncbi:Selenocysteine lyase/Cysteine desulfurase [Epibacterium ulvae]|uniref:Selenocysteine lyase/Cysteine desulfurase n=1 Tax=Epibacterium ulvae TaxID=1156985 RepID=A0A1G5PT40_9RHOB|nr:aminotransferase class V-fold PLP-dependent enzyme [Epibacterium ulvae]SCZ52558.1 Selenocysteine lyase/Cysteine desulfurase [Epibacterium ulvae]
MDFTDFKAICEQDARSGALAQGVIGEGTKIPGLFGDVPLIYADYVASGRALRQVESFVAEHVLPFYANSHTEASYCGGRMTQMRRAARSEIARICGAMPKDKVIFAGSGATAGINRLVSLLGVNTAQRPVVFIGPYEHHSNILPWRESKAKVVEIPEAKEGGVDVSALKQALWDHQDCDLKIGSFSAASNVTGILTDPENVSKILRAHDARVIWDYAGGGPYLPIDMGAHGAIRKDAVVVSPHKFPGGPGASGVLIVNPDIVARHTPSLPGGGTVKFVSPWRHDYSDDLVAREEAGTPNVLGDIRAALAFLVKEAVGQEVIETREHVYYEKARAVFQACSQLELLGHPTTERLPILSFRVHGNSGQPVHQQLFTRMLSDVYGIQARGGCACAGPYAHRLLDIDARQSDALISALSDGKELEKPGWVRLNLSYMMSEATVDYILNSVVALAKQAEKLAEHYVVDASTARFRVAAE